VKSLSAGRDEVPSPCSSSSSAPRIVINFWDAASVCFNHGLRFSSAPGVECTANQHTSQVGVLCGKRRVEIVAVLPTCGEKKITRLVCALEWRTPHMSTSRSARLTGRRLGVTLRPVNVHSWEHLFRRLGGASHVLARSSPGGAGGQNSDTHKRFAR